MEGTIAMKQIIINPVIMIMMGIITVDQIWDRVDMEVQTMDTTEIEMI
jgi:hypothetical protein